MRRTTRTANDEDVLGNASRTIDWHAGIELRSRRNLLERDQDEQSLLLERLQSAIDTLVNKKNVIKNGIYFNNVFSSISQVHTQHKKILNCSLNIISVYTINDIW